MTDPVHEAVVVAFVQEPALAVRTRRRASEAVTRGIYLIGADSGGQTLLEWGLRPTLVIGDMDSIEPTALATLEADGVIVRRSPVEKDETDLELALYAALEMGCSDITILGGLGGRLDHTLGNLYLLAAPRLAQARVRLLAEHEEVFLLRGGQTYQFEGQPGELISLIPFSTVATGIVTDGLYYPLRAESLYLGPGRGISNQFTGSTACVSFDEGLLLAIHTFG